MASRARVALLVPLPVVLPVLLPVVLLLACGEHANAPRVAYRTVGDTTFVSSPADGVDGPVTLVEEARISASAFRGTVAAGAFDAAGGLWLFDDAGTESAIGRFDARGTRLGAVGRLGDGPGEFRPPLRLFRLASGEMLVKEMTTTRLVRFDSAGALRATTTLPAAVAGWVVTPDTVGGWYITTVFEPNTPTQVGRFGWVHFTRDGRMSDTVRPPVHMLREATPDGIAPGRIRTVARDGAVLTTVPGPNRLTRYERGGAVTVFEWPGEPPPYAADERADIQRVEDRLSEMLGKPKAPLPARKEPAHRILTDSEGQVWAHLSGEGVRIPKDEQPPGDDPFRLNWRDRERWAAFRRDGALRFIVDLPTTSRLLDQQGDRLLLAVANDDGAEAIVVARVAPVRAPAGR